MMKPWSGTFLLVLLIVGCNQSLPTDSTNNGDVLPSDLTTEEKALLDDVRKMFRQHDISPMTSRFQRESTEWGAEIHRSILEGIIVEGLGRIELNRIDPPEREKREGDGSIFKWSLPIKWKLIVYESADRAMTNEESYTLSFSEHEGRIVYVLEGTSVEQDASRKGL